MSSRTRAINEKNNIFAYYLYKQGGYYRFERIGNVIEEKSHSGKFSYA